MQGCSFSRASAQFDICKAKEVSIVSLNKVSTKHYIDDG